MSSESKKAGGKRGRLKPTLAKAGSRRSEPDPNPRGLESGSPDRDYLPEHEEFLKAMIERALKAWTRSHT